MKWSTSKVGFVIAAGIVLVLAWTFAEPVLFPKEFRAKQRKAAEFKAAAEVRQRAEEQSAAEDHMAALRAAMAPCWASSLLAEQNASGENVRRAKDVCGYVRVDVINLHPPSEDASQTQKNALHSLYMWKEGWEDVERFLDDRRQSHILDAKEKFRKAKVAFE